MEARPDPEGFDRLYVTAPEWDAAFEVYGACPVQAFGTVRGRDLYFRARHGAWSFDVADSAGNLPSDGYFNSDGFYREGSDPHNGYMPLPEAVTVIAECVREYAGGQAGIGNGSAVDSRGLPSPNEWMQLTGPAFCSSEACSHCSRPGN